MRADRVERKRVEPAHIDHARSDPLFLQPARGTEREAQSVRVAHNEQVLRVSMVHANLSRKKHPWRRRVFGKPRAVPIGEEVALVV
jgi:hypothetical protein